MCVVRDVVGVQQGRKGRDIANVCGGEYVTKKQRRHTDDDATVAATAAAAASATTTLCGIWWLQRGSVFVGEDGTK